MIKKYIVHYTYLGESHDEITKQCGVTAWAEVSGENLTRKNAIKLFNRTHPDTIIIYLRRKTA